METHGAAGKGLGYWRPVGLFFGAPCEYSGVGPPMDPVPWRLEGRSQSCRVWGSCSIFRMRKLRLPEVQSWRAVFSAADPLCLQTLHPTPVLWVLTGHSHR